MAYAVPGMELWLEWDGVNNPSYIYRESVFYYTYDRVDVEHPVVRRALAAKLKLDGIVDSIPDGLTLLEDSYVTTTGYIGFTDDTYHPEYLSNYYNEYGAYDEIPVVSEAPGTWVEINLGNK